MNLLAATTENEEATNQVYNCAVGDRTTLNQLYKAIRDKLTAYCQLPTENLTYRDFRAGDVRHSQADISKAQKLLNYHPTHVIAQGLEEAMEWYYKDLKRES